MFLRQAYPHVHPKVDDWVVARVGQSQPQEDGVDVGEYVAVAGPKIDPPLQTFTFDRVFLAAFIMDYRFFAARSR